MKRGILWLVLLGILMVGLTAGPDLWAAPGQSPERQTVPTRTPTSEPTTPSPTEPPATPTSPSPTVQPMPTPTGLAASPATSKVTPAGGPSQLFLPEAGGRSIRLHLSAAMIVVGLLVLMVVVGRRA